MTQQPPPTGPAVPYPPMPPLPEPPQQPNRPNHPWGPVLVTAGVICVVGGIVQVATGIEPGLPASTIFGEWLGRALIPALVVGFVARVSSRRWHLWTYVVAVVVPTLLLAAIVGAQETVQSRQTLGDDARIVAPAAVDGMKRLNGPRVRALLAQASDEFERTVGDEDGLVTAAYGAPGRGAEGVRVVLIGINLADDGEFAAEARRSPERAVRNVIRGAKGEDSQAFSTEGRDGLMRCAQIPQAENVVMCTWLAAGRLGITLHVTERDLAKAAATTRLLRAAAETPS